MAAESKAKTKSKNKAKNVNKVKIFLANPSKPQCPSLENEDLHELEQLLIDAVNESKQTPRAFATAAHICLGLESTLRAIKNKNAACVLLSTSIKPRYLLGIIARNVETTDDTVPTFAQKGLEDITHKIFGMKTLALVLPKDSDILGDKLTDWMNAHRKPKKLKVPKTSEPAIRPTKRKMITTTVDSSAKLLKAMSVADEAVQEDIETKPWGSSYISFSKESASMLVDKGNMEEDEDKLLSALNCMAKKAKKHVQNTMNVTSATPTAPTAPPTQERTIETEAKTSEEDEDEFLGPYAPLTVHKICPNPNRKPRKKRKKNINKKQNKK